MISQAVFSSTTIPVLEQAVNFAQDRHNVLVGNLANIDTPGYRVRDLSPELFEKRLREAIHERDQSHASPSYGEPPNAGDRLAQLSETTRGILFHDETNISVEQQVAEINKNQTRHNLALAIMNSQFRLLQAAISERA
jgi:flagellar basal-body rod protein FlgB